MSPNLVCALILWRSVLGLLMGKFCWYLIELYARRKSVLSFPDNNLSKCQWIFTKLGVCIDIVEIWFEIANCQISSIFDWVICTPHALFSFSDDNLAKCQWFFTRLGMCIATVEIWFGIAYRQILSARHTSCVQKCQAIANVFCPGFLNLMLSTNRNRDPGKTFASNLLLNAARHDAWSPIVAFLGKSHG